MKRQTKPAYTIPSIIVPVHGTIVKHFSPGERTLTKIFARGKISPLQYADVVELVDSLDLGSNARACRFESCHPHQTNIIRTRFSELEMGSDYLFISPVTSKSISLMVPPFSQVPNPGAHERRKPDKQNEQP